MERYRTVRQHDVVPCPTCGEDLAVVSSVIPTNKTYVCSQCGDEVGSTRGRFAFGQVRVASDEGGSGRRARIR
jgi:DNA-directed RNA polymerase subunit RPC12/RpoP